MNCAEFEILLCDYIDGTLDAARRQVFEEHLQSCAGCAELVRDASGAVAFIERVAEVEPPQELLTKIAFQIPAGRPITARLGITSGWFSKAFQHVLQPKFAMGMAMTILSFSMLGKFAGLEVRQLTADDLRPSKVIASIDDKLHRTWQRGVKYYESLRLVYEVQSRLKEWTDQQETEKKAGSEQPPKPPEK
jgi:hypothetical protein